MPDEVPSTGPPASPQTIPHDNPISKNRFLSITNLLLPFAKGSENYFLGEIQDAGEVQGICMPFIYLWGRKPSERLGSGIARALFDQERLWWAMSRGVSCAGFALPAFMLLSMTGVNYRKFGMTNIWREDHQRRLQLRSEEQAERCVGYGVGAGTFAGATLAKTGAGIGQVRPFPQFVGLMVFTAMGWNAINHEILWLRNGASRG